jgi:histidinol-phosphate aminotransferase
MIQPNKHLLDVDRIIESMEGRDEFVPLDRNDRVTPFPPRVFRAMLATLKPEHFSRYPDPSLLYKLLSRRTGLPTRHLYLTNGSDAAIRMLFQTYVGAGDQVVFPDPSYAMYAIYTRICDGAPRRVAYRHDRTLDVQQLMKTLDGRPRLLVLANPDQPTGSALTLDVLRDLAVRTRETGTLFVVDEAYYPFYPRTAIGMVREFDHVVIIRSFSKISGLAGLRLGFLAASPAVVGHVQKVRGAHEVNGVAIAMGSYALAHPAIEREYRSSLEEGRRVLAGVSRELGLGFPTCRANFQLLQFPGMADTTAVVKALRDKGYLVKGSFAAPSVRDCIRVTLDNAREMKQFAKVLRTVVEKMGFRSCP